MNYRLAVIPYVLGASVIALNTGEGLVRCVSGQKRPNLETVIMATEYSSDYQIENEEPVKEVRNYKWGLFSQGFGFSFMCSVGVIYAGVRKSKRED
jgi:hypothetical protein